MTGSQGNWGWGGLAGSAGEDWCLNWVVMDNIGEPSTIMEKRDMTHMTSSAESIRVFVVDDHPIIRASLRDLFASRPGLCLCGEAESCEEALRKMPEAAPHVVVVDLGLCGSNGFDLLRGLRTRHPQIHSLVFSMHEESKFALRAIKEGALGYLMKTAHPEEILRAVEAVSRGKRVVGERVQQWLLQEASGEGRRTPDRVLSSREWQVFECLGKGLTMKEISGQLKISEKTVGSFCDRIKTKLEKERLRDVAHLAQDWICDDAF